MTDENGFFILEDVPVPEFYVFIDGSNVENAPEGTQYVSLGKAFNSVPGQATQLFMDGESFNIYLPTRAESDIVTLSTTEDTEVGFGSASLEFLQEQFPDIDPAVWQRTQVLFSAGSAMDAQGNTATQAAIVPVDPSRLPAPLPPNLDSRLVISIQAGGESGFNRESDGGATNFDIPAPIQFPNLEGLAPGAKTSIFSFDHDAGDWVNIGSGTVSEDGLVIVSDPGVGILAPGWHTTGSTNTIDGLSSSPADAAFNLANRLQNDQQRALKAAQLGTKIGLDLYEIALNARLTKVAPSSQERTRSTLLGRLSQVIRDLAERLNTVTDYIELFQDVSNLADLINDSDNLRDPEQSKQGQPFGGENSDGDDLISALEQFGDQTQPLDAFLNEALDNFSSEDLGILDNPIGNAVEPGQNFDQLEQEYDRILNNLIPFINGFSNLLTDPNFVQFLLDLSFQLTGWAEGLINSPDILEVLQPLGETYVAISTEDQVFNFQTNTGGGFWFDAPPNTDFIATLYNPSNNTIGQVLGRTGGPGLTTDLGEVLLLPITDESDIDGDGLVDQAEFAIGTSIDDPDTDDDGISDFAEIQQGLDPFGGQAFPTGIIANLPLPGQAKSVALEGSTLEPEGQTAYVATGSHGLAIVDTSQLGNPILLGQLDLFGDATDIAVDTRLGVAAVATNTGGLQFVDVSDPMLPELRQTLNINANQVEVFEGVAYITTGTSIQAIDLLTGENLQTLNLGGSSLTGLTREGLTLYSMDSESRLQSIDISNLEMELLDSLVLPDGSGQLFVANGTAYIPAVSNVRGGFVTVDVSEPDNITLISGSDVMRPNIAAGQDIVANGSGQGILIGSPGFDVGNVLDVIDISDPADTDPFNTILTRVTLPSRPEDVALGSGIAYVANGSSGLQVINYLPFDSFGQAPTITLDSPVTDVDPETPGIQVTEGGLIPLQADVSDDVQVRNIELLVNGEMVSNSVSFPFDLGAIALSNDPNDNTVEVQARATDTGGNSTLSDPLTFELVPDTFAPIIESITPFENGAVPNNLRRVSVRFNEAIDVADVTTENFRLLNSLGEVVTPENIQLQNRDRTVQLTFDPLAAGDYTLVIDADDVSDRAGNLLGTTDITSAFTLLDGTIFWIGGNGNWNDVSNWIDSNNVNRLPTATDIVAINVPGDRTITLNSGSVTVDTLVIEERLAITGGSLTITSESEFNNGLDFNRGFLNLNSLTNLQGTSNWTGGNIIGVGELLNQGQLTINGVSNKTLSSTLTNEGTITHTSSSVFLNNGTVNNQVGALYDLQGGELSRNPRSTGNFNNEGTLRKSTDSTSTWNVAVNNVDGTIDVQQGILQLNSGGDSTGIYFVAPNGLLNFSGGDHRLTENYTVTGDGTVVLSGGLLDVSSDAGSSFRPGTFERTGGIFKDIVRPDV